MQGVGVGALEALGLADDSSPRYACSEEFRFFSCSVQKTRYLRQL